MRISDWSSDVCSSDLFYNLYDGLRSTELDPVTIFPVRLDNGWKGHSYGVEAWASHQFLPWWRLSAGFTTLHKHSHSTAGNIDMENRISLANDPESPGIIRSQMRDGERPSEDRLGGKKG